jgi:hypothetical protein
MTIGKANVDTYSVRNMGETEVYATDEPPSSNEVADAIRRLDWDEPERYRVEWESESRHHPATRYILREISFGEGGKPMIKIVGGRGGEYVIDSNPMGKPLLRYIDPEGREPEERLIQLRIFDTEFNWRNWITRKMP